MTLVHHHFIYQARVGRIDLGAEAADTLKQFLLDLVKEIDMKILIEPQVKFSEHNAWTGLIGIVTSHIAFHYWTKEQLLQLDIYSCKAFDVDRARAFLDAFWRTSDTWGLFIDRAEGNDFQIKKI